MLMALSGKNYFTFDEFYIEFTDGINAITGESGAGKTVFLKALRSVVGFPPAWNSNSLSYVEGLFSLDETTRERIEYLGLDVNGGEVMVTVTFGSQRVMYRLNGKLVPRNIIQKLFADQVEIHSQFDSVRLLDRSGHYLVLDRAIESQELVKKYKESYNDLLKVKREIDSLIVDPASIERERDFLNFQIKEIDDAGLEPGEDEKLDHQYKKYMNAQNLKDSFEDLVQLLKELDGSAYDVINNIIEILRRISNYGYDEMLEHGRIALEEVEYLYDIVSEEADSLDIDAEAFANIESRLNLIQSLKRKYGNSVDEILDMRKTLVSKLDELEEVEKRKNDLVQKEASLIKELMKTGRTIDEERRKTAKLISSEIKNHLEDLRMKGAELEFSILNEEEPRSYGTSNVTIKVKTNPGSEFLEIGRVASGGELSRFLLALESTLKEQLELSTIVFDEIDSGVGQRLGHVLANKLKELSGGVQCLVITHLPQIAELADRHFAVRKSLDDENAVSTIEVLNGENRNLELLAMKGSVPEAR